MKRFYLDIARIGQLRSSVYVAIDCERFSNEPWFALAMLVVDFKSGDVLGYLDCCVPLDLSLPSHPCRSKFWGEHQEALDHSCARAVGTTRASEEVRIASFVAALRTHCPDFYLISDNPVFDVGILNTVLANHDHPTVEFRSEEVPFRQTICTWSFRLGRRRGDGKTSCRIHHLSTMLRSRTLTLKAPGVRCAVRLGPPHSALYDCLHMIVGHFSVMEGVHEPSTCASSTLPFSRTPCSPPPSS